MQITPARTAVTRKISRGSWCTFSLRTPGLCQSLMLTICTCHFLLILVTALLMETEMRLLFRRSVVSDSLCPHGLQHTRLPCPSPSPRVCSNSCPLSQWQHPTTSPSVIPFSSCPQSFPASGSFLMSQLSASGGQSIGASASDLLMNLQDWFPLGLIGLTLQSKGLSRVFSNTTAQKHQFFGTQPSLWSDSHIHT